MNMGQEWIQDGVGGMSGGWSGIVECDVGLVSVGVGKQDGLTGHEPEWRGNAVGEAGLAQRPSLQGHRG